MTARRSPPSDRPEIRLATRPAEAAPAAADPAPGESEPGWRARVVGRSLAPAAEKAVQRGQRLLSAASRLILRSGGDDFTVQKVASEAGLTLRAFYQHFAGKDDLLIALIEESQLVMARLLTRHAARFADPLERIGGARRPVLAVFTRLVDEAMNAGAIERGDPERSAFAWMALQDSFTRVTYLGNDLSSRVPSVPELVRFCVLGLGARLPVGWESRFVLSDEEAALSRRASERLAAESLRGTDTR
jgi:AcrR family transcriptional regulator